MSREVESAEVLSFLQTHDRFLILTHKSPDGDTLGTAAALTRALLAMQKQVRIINADAIPAKYQYLFDGIPSLDFEPETIVAVDVADTKLLGDALQPYADRVQLCIDHHVSNRRYAELLYLRPEDGAAALSLYRIFRENRVPITKEMADDLYTGLSTDTGCFRYANADAHAYRAAADLISLGADNVRINEIMFETKPYSYYRLLQETLNGMRMFCGGKIAVFKVSQNMLKRTGATEDQCDAICAMSRTIEGVELGVTMKEKKAGRYKFSLRTRDSLDASALGRLLGGGGHVRAAGCDAGEDEEASLRVLLEAAASELGTAL